MHWWFSRDGRGNNKAYCRTNRRCREETKFTISGSSTGSYRYQQVNSTVCMPKSQNKI